jgi:hypothetical protein
MATTSVLLECRRTDGPLRPLDLDAAVQLVVDKLAAYGFSAQAERAYVREGADRPPGAPGVDHPSVLYVPGTITGEFPESGEVTDHPWHIRIFADLIVGGRSLALLEAISKSTEQEVKALLGADDFKAKSLTGKDIAIAILDDGINLQHIANAGVTATVDTTASASTIGTKPGQAPLSHGTMCAFDALLMAPDSMLIDLACLKPYNVQKPKAQAGLLSDVHKMYTLFEKKLPAAIAKYRAIVMNNSWAIVNARNDPGTTHKSGYIGNPHHPLNTIVAEFVTNWDIDVLFSAGNCAPGSTSMGCSQDQHSGTIYGANSLEGVLTISAVNVDGSPWVEASQGPGRLYADKPDICMYSNFVGSEIEGPNSRDRATSAACAVAAGLVACIRTKQPAYPLNSGNWTTKDVSDLLRTKTFGGGFNHKQGHGTVNGPAIAASL